MNKLIMYVVTAIVPVILAWALGYLKPPDSINLIDYSSSGSELINSEEQLTSSLKIQANNKPIEKLSIYTIRFSNNSSKNLNKVNIEFKIKSSKDSELVASAIKGPQNYSDSLIKKIAVSKTSVTYTLEFINIATNNNYFTASFLFSGQAPDTIIPVSLTPSINFSDAKENNKNNIISILLLSLIVLIYIIFIVWSIYTLRKEGKEKQVKFEEKVTSYFVSSFPLTLDQAIERTKDICEIKESIYKPENKMKKWIKNWLFT